MRVGLNVTMPFNSTRILRSDPNDLRAPPVLPTNDNGRPQRGRPLIKA
jgi:hypothetical protein